VVLFDKCVNSFCCGKRIDPCQKAFEISELVPTCKTETGPGPRRCPIAGHVFKPFQIKMFDSASNADPVEDFGIA
jgi:hypothetical protein